ncbi:Rossmann-like and DUF2520 domain-containing protein [Myroides sp. LJL119]
MITVSILGAGKVAHHLISTILEKDHICIKQIYARNPNQVSQLISSDKIISDITKLEPCDIIVIAVSDHAIEKLSEQIQLDNPFVVHTSGTVSMQAIKNTTRKGVFYMLQSFSLEKEVDFKNIPFCLEASNLDDFALLEKLALEFSQRVYDIDSEQRKVIHLSAVFANNFSNHMYTLAKQICDQNKVPFEILKPLILETAIKAQTLDPISAQTGPAMRKDQQTIDKHLELIKDPLSKQIYELITKSITKNNV